VAPLAAGKAQQLMHELAPEWQLASDARSIRREFKFRDFYRTMSFVNALAHVANIEDHHPDLEVGYNYCRVLFTTHAIGGLSDNDFICAAKSDEIALSAPPAAGPR
jgi:4a-hydroxytetrahydrobiopterin dehydratase